MKVLVYALLEERASSCRWTLDPEADRWFWLAPGVERFRQEQGLDGGAGKDRLGEERLIRGLADRIGNFEERGVKIGCKMLVWDEPLPLGAAIEAAARWRRMTSGRELEQKTAEGALRRCVQEAMEAEGGFERQGAKINGSRAEYARPILKWGPTGDGGLIDAADGDGGQPDAPRPPSAAGKSAAFAALTRQARQDAEQLRGRALHVPEALALLGVAEWRELAPRLQFAALLGLARLEAAVAPAPPLSGRWRQRGAAPRPRRCQRCGSGEAQLRRTPCASCGRRACAYCEACLAMGRSRECGLLILGTPSRACAAPPSAAPQLSMAARLAPWNLSPAQQAAAAAALRYIESAPPQEKRRAKPAARLREAWRRLAGRFAALSAPPLAPAYPRLPRLLASASNRLRLLRGDGNRADREASALSAPQPLLERDEQPAATALLAATDNVPRRQFLLWAVTGAGKTEMIFPLVAAALERGGRALIATPRRDVVLELDPRIRRAFPAERVVTLFGGSPQRWESGCITLATTHQLFRFREGFDLVIIDEIDAFPYHGDPQLHYAASRSLAPDGATVLLSATPPAKLRGQARRGSLPHARVPVRFHGHPLPVPAMLRMPAVDRLLRALRFPPALRRALQASLDRGAQLFVFVQRIRHVAPLVARLRREFKAVAIDGTSSKDEERADKVRLFRDGAIRLLVTTTILERGVTIPRSDVFILDADGRLFDDASLIQMAGRAGRSLHDPAGRVYFGAPAVNNAQRSAVKEIRAMNRIAMKKGYLKANESGKPPAPAKPPNAVQPTAATPDSPSVAPIAEANR
ncbi:late competence protein required for DNA uptake (superfamily II DNA/RNA helicase) [Paenibacillus methanolicus]|uniref:Late competence protein required for DNA uptake (Superfamily II DNA/RNA helicase) n=2 Tax=Paenibacillus methanolicus TaxID=582686 RepID=A0A5S5C8U0_9BACL|nr:late competence protein required for DNA uptake (superfamily II DNA/RNA helicase) [Paenibacillus methanolicus]